jgi:hypothetical protein
MIKNHQNIKITLKKVGKAGCRWLMPVILSTQEAEIRRTAVQTQPEQIVCKTLSRKYSPQKGEGPEFKTQYCKK